MQRLFSCLKCFPQKTKLFSAKYLSARPHLESVGHLARKSANSQLHSQHFDYVLHRGSDILSDAIPTYGAINGVGSESEYPKELVKSKFLKLDFTHLQYVMECFLKNTTKVANIKKYLLAMLFNAPSTIGSYYRAEVNHDMPQFAKA